MTVDVRATVLCTLGELISGNLADESVTAGQGIIRCRGNVEIKGLITPAPGTKVAFAYERNGYVSRIPRLLRVLSSFADPFRGKTTVALGCKLTYQANAAAVVQYGEPITYPIVPSPGDTVEQAWDWPLPEVGSAQPTGDITDPDANPFTNTSSLTYNGICWQYDDVDEYDPNNAVFNFSNSLSAVIVTPEEQWRSIQAQQRRKLPISVSGRFIAAKCLAALRISSRAIPLTNWYASDRFDLSSGYIKVLDELLASEAYVGYLDEAEVFNVVSILDEPSTGPVFTNANIIDLQPLNIGMLPGGELRLKIDPVEYNYDPRFTPRCNQSIVGNAAPIAYNITGPASYAGASVIINALANCIDPDGDPMAVAAVTVDSGGTVAVDTLTGLCRFTPSGGFEGVAELSYSVSDGASTSNTAKIYVQCETAESDVPLGLQVKVEEAESAISNAQSATGGVGTVSCDLDNGEDQWEDQSRRNWEYDRSESSTQTVEVIYDGGTAVYSYAPVTVTTSTFDVYDRARRRTTVTNDIVARTNGALVKALNEAGLGSVGSSECITIEETIFEYNPIYLGDAGEVGGGYGGISGTILRTSADRPAGEERIQGSVCTVNGRCPNDLSLPTSPANNDRHIYGACAYQYSSSTNSWSSVDPESATSPGASITAQPDGGEGEDSYRFLEEQARASSPRRQVTTKYESLHNVMGRLNLPLSSSLYIIPSGVVKTEQTIVEFSQSGGVTKTITNRYIGQAFTQEGQQAFAAFAQNAASEDDLWELLNSASTLILDNSTVQTQYDKQFGNQGRPSTNERLKTDLTGGSGASLDVDSGVTSPPGFDSTPTLDQGGNGPVLDLSPPYTGEPQVTPDGSGGITYIEPNAQGQGLRYITAYNAILRGNRYGLGLTLEAWQLPRYPLEGIYLQIDGVAGAYKSNGMTWAFSSSGIISNIDAMLWGAAGGDLGSAWFSVAPGVESLPSLPSTTTATPVPANSIATPDLFDPLAPGTLWADLPYGDAPTYAATMAPATVVPLVADTITVLCGVRVGIGGRDFAYSFAPQTADDSFIGVTVGIDATVHYELTAESVNLTLTPQDASFIGGYSITGESVALTLTPQDADMIKAITLTGDAVSMAMAPQDAGLVYFDNTYDLIGDAVAMTLSPQDADFIYVGPTASTLLLHFDGTDGSTTFTDSSANGWTITPSGTAQLSTSSPKFGTASGAFDGSANCNIVTPSDSAFAMGTNDFTFDFWATPNTVSSNDGVFGFVNGLCVSLNAGNWRVASTGGTGNLMGAATAGVRVHVALTRSGSSVRFFLNGVQTGSTLTFGTNFTATQLRIGYYISASTNVYDGLIDEFRYIKGTAEWTADFTPPSSPYTA
jgi:hypothetical protein